MTVPGNLRKLVVARAGGACEYCRLVELACGVTFHVEHFVPESKGGIATLSNFVLSCPGCNLAKGVRTFIVDADGAEQAFLQPSRIRTDASWLASKFHAIHGYGNYRRSHSEGLGNR